MSTPKFDPELDIDGSGIDNGFRADRAAAAVEEWLGEDKLEEGHK